MSYFSTVSTQFADSGSIDAFSRQRVSLPTNVFDAQLTYNLVPMLHESITNGTGATVTHDATNRMALMTFASTPTGGKAYMQSYEYIPYQPGKSQLVFITFNFIDGVTNVIKFAGLSDGTNGIEFQLSGTTKQFTVYSSTSNGNETVTQSNWNLDKLDGTGISGITLDLTKTQICVIDFQALYVGRVRVGFDIAGKVYYAHEFNHANLISTPYMATANLPVRCGMTSTGTVSTTMNFICSSVISEGGDSNPRGYTFAQEGNVTAASGTATHILSVRPLTTFNSLTNRIKFELDAVNVLVTGSNSIRWDLVVGQAITGTTTYTAVNSTSAFEYNVLGTASGSPAVVIASGYCGQATGAGVATSKIASKYPISLSQAGAVRANGTISLLVTGISGNSACRAMMQWREVR